MITNNKENVEFPENYHTLLDLSLQLEEKLAQKEAAGRLWLSEENGKYIFVSSGKPPKQLKGIETLIKSLNKAMMGLYQIVVDRRENTSKDSSEINNMGNVLKKLKKLTNFVQHQWNPSKEERLALYANKRIVNFGLKKKLSLQSVLSSEEQGIREVEIEIHKKFDGCSWFDNLAFGHESVTDFINANIENVDREGLLRIQAHRKILKDIKSHMDTNNFSTSNEEVFHFFEQRVKALKDPNSELVVHHADGSTSFGIPGGCIGHAVLYEIKKDSTGNYYFLLHNKGSGLERALHNQQVFQKDESKYRNTTIVFRIKENILNRDFFTKLLQTTDAINMHAAYDWLEQEIFEKPSSYFPVFSDDEDELQLMQSSLNSCFVKSIPLDNSEIIDLGIKLIDKNVYHSIQKYRTCGESCKTVAEKSMCDKKTRLKLKLFTIQKLVEFIEAQKSDSNDKDREGLLMLGKIRMESLTRKIA